MKNDDKAVSQQDQNKQGDVSDSLRLLWKELALNFIDYSQAFVVEGE